MWKQNKKNPKKPPMRKAPATRPFTELTDQTLEQVMGGINPQPLPPRGPEADLLWR